MLVVPGRILEYYALANPLCHPVSEGRMKITVLPTDREHAIPCMSRECLLAEAIKRELNTTNVVVVTSTIVINGTWYTMDAAALSLRNKFDSGYPVELPQEIELTRMPDKPA
jgi:hypothetical protein